MLHLVNQNIDHDEFWILLTNDTYISKVHQLNQICDFKYLSREPGCLTFSHIYNFSYPCFHRIRKIFKIPFKCTFNAFY